MSDYTYSANLAAKDNLSSGDANKKILGATLETEFEAVETAIATKLDEDFTALTEDTAPIAATDWVASYDVSASANKKVLLNKFPRFFVGTTTRSQGSATGTQAITGVGFKPRFIFATAHEAGTLEFSMGFSDGSTDVVTPYHASSDNWTTSSGFITIVQSGGNTYIGALDSFDDDGFTIGWTRTGTPSGTIILNYVCVG